MSEYTVMKGKIKRVLQRIALLKCKIAAGDCVVAEVMKLNGYLTGLSFVFVSFLSRVITSDILYLAFDFIGLTRATNNLTESLEGFHSAIKAIPFRYRLWWYLTDWLFELIAKPTWEDAGGWK